MTRSTVFDVGDWVVSVCDIWNDPSGDSPAYLYAKRGDWLVVRDVESRWGFCCYVSRPGRMGNSFGVKSDEISYLAGIKDRFGSNLLE